MTSRPALFLLALLPAAGCTWDDRPDGASPTHTEETMYEMSEDPYGPAPLGVAPAVDPFMTEAETVPVEPLDGAVGAVPSALDPTDRPQTTAAPDTATAQQ